MYILKVLFSTSYRLFSIFWYQYVWKQNASPIQSINNLFNYKQLQWCHVQWCLAGYIICLHQERPHYVGFNFLSGGQDLPIYFPFINFSYFCIRIFVQWSSIFEYNILEKLSNILISFGTTAHFIMW